MTTRRLVVVSAGLSQPSSTRLLADQVTAATRAELERLGIDAGTRVIELREQAHDVMNHLLTGFASAGLRETLDAVAGADGLIAVTPVFNASYSGLFKSFADVLADSSLVDKPVLIAATGGTARHSLALEYAVRPLFAHLGAVVVPTAVFAAPEDWAGRGDPEDWAGSGEAADRALRERIARAARELAVQMSQRGPARVADPFALPAPFEDLLTGP
jgi:FMN reductase